MYKVKHVAISVFIIIGACSFTLALQTSASEHIKKTLLDSIDVNGKNETVPSYTEINNITTVPALPPQPSSENPTTISPNVTTTKPNSTTTTPVTTSTTPTTTSVKPTTLPPSPNTTTIAPNVTTSTLAPNSTTPTPVTTVKPTTVPTTPVPSHRRFDGPSFIGGIVLALGLVAIGFVAFKFYKARTELNYHTL